MYRLPNLRALPANIGQAWQALRRYFETNVEHTRVTNHEGTTMLKGTVVHLVAGNRQVERALNDTALHADAVGVMAEAVAAGARGIMRRAGYAFVLFEPLLTPAAGLPCWVSSTPGLATDVAPGEGTYLIRLGIIGDDTTYTGTGGCWVFLDHCCGATAARQG